MADSKIVRLGGLVLWMATGFGAAGCASGGAVGADERMTGSAARIYWVGEERFAQGDHAQAVALWRHALLQLPESADADTLRHDLILRIAYGQLVAHHHTGDRAQLEAAATTLNRYVRRHEALFGETEAAQRERGEIYELLYTVESQLEDLDTPPVSTTGTRPDPAVPVAPVAITTLEPATDPNPRGAPGTGALVQSAAPAVADPDPGAPEMEAEPSSDRAPARVTRFTQRETPVDTHAGEVLDPRHNERRITVDTRGLATLDDPRVRAGLRSRFFDPRAGLVLSTPGTSMLHGPRPLVRAYALPKALEDRADARDRRLARRVGFDVIRTARQGLRDCYGDAFARIPALVSRGTFEVWVRTDGVVHRARLTDGGVVDPLGDVCAIEALENTRLNGSIADARDTIRVRLQLVFFYQDAVSIDGMGNSAAVGSPMVPSADQVTPLGPSPVVGPMGGFPGGPQAPLPTGYGRPR